MKHRLPEMYQRVEDMELEKDKKQYTIHFKSGTCCNVHQSVVDGILKSNVHYHYFKEGDGLCFINLRNVLYINRNF